ncbi:anhydro-N-acetylmuramic acid kinase [Streptomyces chumphonensis]|uniref:Anhydro-N-acetylmuramic acid kinase n=1 Tax=Streptomyces chumphonensis TaxID=1214925 RepID=A0A927EYQ3_9ACTN|nr:anhydro-N-acetylmuramic acid kinase [Streptomyces chumphonensis]MBD3931192.1 anhydro-N-acetylmuramic acid kinase [Streptomyces chumphonensis]
MRVIGMLSGTSCDAVDAALADLTCDPDGELTLCRRGLLSVPFPPDLHAELASCLPPAEPTWRQVCRLDAELGRFFGAAAARADTELAGGTADLVVSHGQTCYHLTQGPRALGTLQLGAPAWIAEATGLPVVSDLRTRDLARGGQGAPLAATLDALLLPHEGRPAALNLGGIANLSFRDGDGQVLAYDLGPANALIDAAARHVSGGRARRDDGGARAARGSVRPELLAALLADPYYRLPPPKSTGREHFHTAYLLRHLPEPPPPADDLLATVTELTARLVADACRRHGLTALTVSGGGVRNPVLMARIRTLTRPLPVADSSLAGLPAQAKEAYLFALLGFLTVHGVPGNVPSATGARGPALLGSLTPGAGPLRLPPPLRRAPTRLRVTTSGE